MVVITGLFTQIIHGYCRMGLWAKWPQRTTSFQKCIVFGAFTYITYNTDACIHHVYIYIFTSKNAGYRICNFVIVINISYPQLRLPSILFHPVAKNGRFSQVHWRLVQDWTSQGAGGVLGHQGFKQVRESDQNLRCPLIQGWAPTS